MRKDEIVVNFDKQSLIDYAVEIEGKIVGWIQKTYLGGNSGHYYYSIRINLSNGAYLIESPWKLSEAKEMVRKFIKENV